MSFQYKIAFECWLMWKYKNFYYEGKKVEKLLIDTINNDGKKGLVYSSSKKEDVTKHVDLWWETPKEGKIGIDVKGMKRIKRSDNSFSTDETWIELQNVKGEKGWLYGDADAIAFQYLDNFIFVKREILANFIEEKVKDVIVSTNFPSTVYELYQRSGRKDIICRVPIEDIKSLQWFTLAC